MLREVRGLGTLVPEDIRWIPAQTNSKVERIVLRPGAIIHPNSVILELSDPQLQPDLLDAQYQLKGAEADFANLKGSGKQPIDEAKVSGSHGSQL